MKAITHSIIEMSIYSIIVVEGYSNEVERFFVWELIHNIILDNLFITNN
jgi:hypothetical protein